MLNPENPEILVSLFIGALLSIIFVLLMVRNTKNLKSPYNKILNGIFVFGLITFLLSLLLQYLGYVIADLVRNLAYFAILSGVIILSWEEFKRGYEETVIG